MTPLLFVLAAATGAIGRHLVGRIACSWKALLFVNTAGAAILGWVAAHDLSESAATILGAGLCGALTTFSSFALEARTLGWKLGSAYAVATIVCVTSSASLATTL